MTKNFDEKTVNNLVEAAEGNPRAMVQLARTMLMPMKQEERAMEICERALLISGNDPEIAAVAQMIFTKDAESFYFSMVQDTNRHALYVEALKKLITPGCHVLDIGAGTGLFAMLAARAGAGTVTACEATTSVANAARKVVEKNGLSQVVNLVSKRSTDLVIGNDMNERADVLIWDNLANNLIGAGALKTLEDARERLLKPDAIIIPGRVEVCAALVENKRKPSIKMAEVEGFDLSPFNMLRDKAATINGGYALRSEPVTLFDFDFQSGEKNSGASSRKSVTTLPGAINGPVNGIVQWLRFHLAEDVVYDTSGEGVRAFGEKFHPLETFDTSGSEKYQICGSHDGQSMWIWLER